MIKRHFFLFFAVALVALMALGVVLKMAFADDGEGSGGPAGASGGGRGQLVSQVQVTERDFIDEIRVVGVARGRRSVNITASASQLITRVLFRDGQSVSAGQPLVELRAQEQDAGVIEARARLTQAERELERFRTLAERGVAPRVTAEQAETDVATARAAVAAAEARLGDRVIRAPFAGVLGLTTVTPGTLISPGAVITTLDDISVIRVDFPVPERYLGVLRPGVPLTAAPDALGGEPLSGRITTIDTRIDETTRAVTVRAEFANPGARIRPGMMMRVAVQQGRRHAFALPEAAIQYEGDGAFVYRIARGEQGMNAQRVEVETGAVEGGFVEILSGLSASDSVVGSGLNRIQPGAPIRLGQATPAGGATGR